jgi:hypothetical protein
VIDVVFQAVEIVSDDRDKPFIVVPVKSAYRPFLSRSNALKHIALSNANERKHFVDIRQPENAWYDGIFSIERLDICVSK